MRPNDLAVARADEREDRTGRAVQAPAYAPRAAGPWRRLTIALIASLLAVAISLPLATRLDPVIGDLLLFRFADISATKRDDIVIVTLTEDTLAQFPYRSPIDRGFLADLISTLDAAGPKAIGLDILLDSPSDPDKDRRLFDAIDRASSPVILAVAKGAALLTDRQYAYLQEVVTGRKHGSVILQRDDTDGILRHLPQPHDRSGEPVLTFTAALAEAGTGPKPVTGRILYHPPEQDGAPAFPRYPAQTVAFLPPDWFAGKYVLIGTDLPNIDRHPTPLVSIAGSAAGTLPGIVIHAHILAQVLSGRMIGTLSLTQTLLLMAAAALAVALIFGRTRRPGRFALFLAGAIAVYAFGVWFLVSNDILMPPGPRTSGRSPRLRLSSRGRALAGGPVGAGLPEDGLFPVCQPRRRQPPVQRRHQPGARRPETDRDLSLYRSGRLHDPVGILAAGSGRGTPERVSRPDVRPDDRARGDDRQDHRRRRRRFFSAHRKTCPTSRRAR